MKLLIITNLFPNHLDPERGIFNKQQFTRLAKFCDLKVVAPLPWFPKLPIQNKRSIFADIVQEEKIEGIDTFHPRYLVIPKIGRALYGMFYYLGIRGVVKKIERNFSFDAILATWAYPDCFAAARLAQQLNKPLVVKFHGTDINVLAQSSFRRKMIVETCQKANHIIVVTAALKKQVVEFGIDAKKITVIPNGVDTEVFTPLDQKDCQQKLGLAIDKKHIVFIGHLTPIKGLFYLIEALKQLPEDVYLSVIGDGELQSELDAKIAEFNLQKRVKFFGKRPHSEIVQWMNAADVFCLPSLNEGCPNVVLEALACGRPVVASRVGGIPEIMVSDYLGITAEAKNARSLAHALAHVLNQNWDARKIRDYALRFSWDEGAKKIFELVKTLV